MNQMKIKKICCIGAGYVGGPTMAVIALKCPELIIQVVDINEEKILMWNSEDLKDLPVYEPGLPEIIEKVRGKNLFFSSDIDQAIIDSEMIFLAVNTPTKTSGEGKGMAVDLKFIESSAKHIARVAESDKIIIEKSTLPVRTAERLKYIFSQSKTKVNFEVLSNPEFLAEGTAINDLFKSDRVLIGGDDTKSGKEAVDCLSEIYEKWIPKHKILKTNVWSSELSKLAANAMLAQRISSINSLSVLCEKTGANINEISKAIGMDKRIGSEFLNASVGYGGSCFQKDILNLVYLCRHYNLNEVADFWHQVVKINDYQKDRFSANIKSWLDNDLKNKKIALLGWAFKKNTNDSRESAAIYVANYLLKEGAKIHVYDPMVASSRVKNDVENLFNQQGFNEKQINSKLQNLSVEKNHEEAIINSSVTAIVTEWDEFKSYDWNYLSKTMIGPSIIYDGRNILNNVGKNVKLIKLGC